MTKRNNEFERLVMDDNDQVDIDRIRSAERLGEKLGRLVGILLASYAAWLVFLTLFIIVAMNTPG